jgi:phosphoribosyl 1,2-cyclic phosphodiesterase
MKLLFPGTRGEIEARSPLHRRHSVLVIAHARRRIVIDCEADWRGRMAELRPDAVLLTHAHPDHAYGLDDGAPCPVYATAETWALLRRYRIADRRDIAPRRPWRIANLRVEAFAVEHSIRCPAVGYRIGAGRESIFYAPDLVSILSRSAALRGIGLYIGDGATIIRPIIRHRGRHRIGHAAIREQIAWCARAGVTRALFTHCGTEIVTSDPDLAAARVRELGRSFGVEAGIARDNLVVRSIFRS